MFTEHGHYSGAKDIVSALQDDTVRVKLPPPEGRSGKAREYEVSRWAYVVVKQKNVSESFDLRAQDFMKHGTAQFKNSEGNTFAPGQDFEDTPIIAVRTYTTADTALINLLYHQKYGYHRCNLVLDEKMGAGVYAYTDIVSLLNSLPRKEPMTKHAVIGVIYGYLHKVGTPRTRICLDPRSCKRLVFFTQFQIPAGTPFTMGEEAKYCL